MIRIAELEFDDYNLEELARHGVRPREVLQLVDNPFTVRGTGSIDPDSASSSERRMGDGCSPSSWLRPLSPTDGGR